MTPVKVTDLAGVVYSSGKVFDGLSTGRLDTENFLRSGSLDGVTSRGDLALLEDLRDVSQFIIDNQDRRIDVAFVREVNAQLTRSASIFPGKYRTAEQDLGVGTRYGRHEPAPVTDASLQSIVDKATGNEDPARGAVDLFIELAKAQPFSDGNKRTALFTANALLLQRDRQRLLTIPVDENDPSVADAFNDALARAYRFDDHDGVRKMLQEKGLVPIERTDVPKQSAPAPKGAEAMLDGIGRLSGQSRPERSEDRSNRPQSAADPEIETFLRRVSDMKGSNEGVEREI